MENEKSESNRTTHEIEGIGSIRAQNGTALETVAGAAAYWQKEAKAFEKLANSYNAEDKKKWRDGFLTGSVSVATLTLVALFLARFLF